MDIIEYENCKSILVKYLHNNNPEFTMKNLNGLTNKVYLINHNENNIILKIYGKAAIFIDREMEEKVINHANEIGLCPKILFSGDNAFRIEEFLNDYIQATNILLLNNLDNFIRDLISFNCLETIEYTSRIGSTLILKDKTNSNIVILKNNNLDNKNDFVGYFLKNLLDNALIHINTQIEQCDSNIKIIHMKMIKEVINNFDDLYYSNFPQKGLLVLSHNDLHKGNIMFHRENNKIKFLDMEFCKLNLFGLDFVNFVIELNFDYSNYPLFIYEKIDFEEKYKLYYRFYQVSLKTLDLEEFYGSFDYFKNLVKLCSLFWIIVESYYFNDNDQEFDYLSYCIERLEIIKSINKYNN